MKPYNLSLITNIAFKVGKINNIQHNFMGNITVIHNNKQLLISDYGFQDMKKPKLEELCALEKYEGPPKYSFRELTNE